MSNPKAPTMLQTLTNLLNSPEGTTINLSRGLSLRIATREPLMIECIRQEQFPSPTEVHIVRQNLEKLLGHNNTYEGTDHKATRDPQDRVKRRWGVATITAYAPTTTPPPPHPSPITYTATPERLFTLPTPPTYPD
jgi:hypothetical protein